MITPAQLHEAIDEARRFINKAEQLQIAMAQPGKPWIYGGETHISSPVIVKEHAACKRSSMDLSRALAALRKGDV